MTRFNSLFAHPFNKDGQTHVVVTAARKVSRQDSHLTLCALRLDNTFQRRAPATDRLGMTAPTCDGCTGSLVGMFDSLEAGEDRPTTIKKVNNG